MDVTYLVDGRPVVVQFADNTDFASGDDICLAEKFRDMAAGCEWFRRGYVVKRIFTDEEFRGVREALERIIIKLLQEHSVDTVNFSLESYHHYVDDALHWKIIQRTRRLFPDDFRINVNDTVKKIEDVIGAKLGFYNPLLKKEHWLISRINRPGSNDFNTVHKDIYEAYDGYADIPRMINCWIPVCGVDDGTGLPMAPGSHLVPESRVQRTKAGSTMNGNAYSVNAIASWDGQNSLVTVAPGPGEAIIFSSHLVHGLARNRHPDRTRISFEFRLYES